MRWADDHAQAIGAIDPTMSEEIYNRVADNWRPLFAIADVAGGEWPDRVRVAAVTMLSRRWKLARGSKIGNRYRARVR